MAENTSTTGAAPEELSDNILITTVDSVYNLARSYSLWPMTFGLACCAIEFIVAGTARYDMSRFGMEVARPSPRQADLLIISGTVTKKMVVPIVRLYNQMAEPRYVISMGACATGGGPFKEGYNVVSGIDKFLPVDVYVPGCPPTPEALIHGFITLHKKFKTQSVRTVPWYRKSYTGETPIPVLGPDIIDTHPDTLKRVRDVNMTLPDGGARRGRSADQPWRRGHDRRAQPGTDHGTDGLDVAKQRRRSDIPLPGRLRADVRRRGTGSHRPGRDLVQRWRHCLDHRGSFRRRWRKDFAGRCERRHGVFI